MLTYTVTAVTPQGPQTRYSGTDEAEAFRAFRAEPDALIHHSKKIGTRTYNDRIGIRRNGIEELG